MATGRSGKLSIWGYERDPTDRSKGGNPASPNKRFEAPINPEKFSFSRAIRTNSRRNLNNRRNVRQIQGSDSARVSFELLFDDSGIAYSAGKSVETYLKELQDVVFKYEGNIHKPLYLKVFWGNFHFFCHLDQMTVEASLFAPDGKVIRAKVSLSFVEHASSRNTEAESWNRSPDLTHLKTVRQGDTIMQMTYDIYDDYRYYLEVARINGLVNFRNLKVGQELSFPPLEK